MCIKAVSKDNKRKKRNENLNQEFVKEFKPTEKELDRLNSRMDKNHEIRNELLRFSFTSVIATLGAALAIKDISVPLLFLFLFPFVIMIPFQARISYYRMEEAHIQTYIAKLCREHDMYQKMCTDGYYEGIGIRKLSYAIIAWLINHELVLLSAFTCIIFWFKFFSNEIQTDRLIWLGRLLPVVLLAVVWMISHSTYSFLNMCYRYSIELEKIQTKWQENRISREKTEMDKSKAKS